GAICHLWYSRSGCLVSLARYSWSANSSRSSLSEHDDNFVAQHRAEANGYERCSSRGGQRSEGGNRKKWEVENLRRRCSLPVAVGDLISLAHARTITGRGYVDLGGACYKDICGSAAASSCYHRSRAASGFHKSAPAGVSL